MNFEIQKIDEYYVLKLNSQILDLYTTAEAAGEAIESVKTQLTQEIEPKVFELDINSGTLTEVV